MVTLLSNKILGGSLLYVILFRVLIRSLVLFATVLLETRPGSLQDFYFNRISFYSSVKMCVKHLLRSRIAENIDSTNHIFEIN